MDSEKQVGGETQYTERMDARMEERIKMSK
jgi:hypothetical protein